eukprot:TRINITY_DN26832_c0_g1_i1.p2 TRINITY_DN26832_c0_g1~~TRINITY_DN26832_c0_g1_i1.p2  ORF type:complete len:193 (+),score=40.56 TRINITY_DN26832_c0_g1_i1:78-656(+)
MAPQEMSLYTILGVSEEADNETLKRAYRAKALEQHPDKGGDQSKFDELAKAYKLLDDPKQRETYDEQLGRQRERAELVEGGRAATAEKRVDTRVKTEPTPGSKTSMKKQAMSTNGYRSVGSAVTVLKALTDDTPEEAVADALFAKYTTLPRCKEKRQEWGRKLKGPEKQALKACAKAHEKEQMEKWQKWLNK